MTMDQFFTYYLPITVTLFVTLLSSYLLAAACARLTRKAGSPANKAREAQILRASGFTWKLVRLGGALLGLAACLWLYPAARHLAAAAL